MSTIIHAGGGGDSIAEAWVRGDNTGASSCLVNADSYKLASYSVDAPWSSSSGKGSISFKLNSGYTELHCLIVITGQSSNSEIKSFSGATLTHNKISSKVFECWFTDITKDTFQVDFSLSAPAAVRAYMTLIFDD